jgi:uncharacterized sulfatase
MPTMREMRRLHKDGKLEGPQKLFFRPEKPEFELYDDDADPHEIRNLADSPQHRDVLDRLRRALDDWMKQIHDLGLIPEEQLLERMRPGGQWAATAAPSISFSGSRMRITCATEGASIAYSTEPGGKWKLYTKEVTLAAGVAVRAKACRLGYTDSPEVQARSL